MSPATDPSVKLVEHTSSEGRYITLSHCWGTYQHFVLKSEDLLDYGRGISFGKLPKTFQDAITFCVELGVYQIWIDALCIMQDDSTDWQIESAKMADISQNAYLTLAATASSNDMSGCFAKVKTADVVEYELAAKDYLWRPHKIMVRKKLQHWGWPPSGSILAVYPLLSRGWAFQERILSPRVLHFCKEELVWECREESVCECGSLTPYPVTNPRAQAVPLGLLDSRTTEKLRSNAFKSAFIHFKRRIKTSLLHRVPRTSEFNLELKDGKQWKAHVWPVIANWHMIVEQYSALKLTLQPDRLPTLSGLAVRSSSLLGFYLAGLWSNSLTTDLVWRVEKLDIDTQRSTEYIGPSWSWVSVTAPITYWKDNENRTLQDAGYLNAFKALVDRVSSSSFFAEVEVSGANPFGTVRSGKLKAHAHLQLARLKYVYTRLGGGSQGLAAQQELVPLQYEIEIMCAAEDYIRIPSMELPFFADYVLRDEGPNHIADNEMLYLLLIHHSVCLVLKGVDDADSSTFRRVGVVRQPWALISDYGLDWMLGSKLQYITVI